MKWTALLLALALLVSNALWYRSYRRWSHASQDRDTLWMSGINSYRAIADEMRQCCYQTNPLYNEAAARNYLAAECDKPKSGMMLHLKDAKDK